MTYSEERKQAIKQGVWRRKRINSMFEYVNGIQDPERIKVLLSVAFELYMVDKSEREGNEHEA